MSAPKPFGQNWTVWGNRLTQYLDTVRSALVWRRGETKAPDDGILLWDNEHQKAVVSNGGEYKALRYGHGDHLLVYTTATHSAASTNTAYAITWENSAYGDHIAVDDTVTSRIVFEHAGTYNIEFSCQLQSGNSSSKTAYIWPRKNGTDLPYSTIVHSITSSGVSMTVSRSGIFSVEAGDYVEAMFAVTDTNLTIQGSGATAFSPASPSATMNIVEVDI